jgi:hypothetical protein
VSSLSGISPPSGDIKSGNVLQQRRHGNVALRKHVRQSIVQVQPALLNELQHRRGSEQLGQRTPIESSFHRHPDATGTIQ